MKWLRIVTGFAAGLLNGLFGAGGGMAAVPLLRRSGLETKQAHATSIAIILPISIFSAFLYWYNGTISLSDGLIYLPGGIVGAIVGALWMKKMNPIWLRRIFGCFMLYAGIRLVMK